jgi:hypothetical protein
MGNLGTQQGNLAGDHSKPLADSHGHHGQAGRERIVRNLIDGDGAVHEGVEPWNSRARCRQQVVDAILNIAHMVDSTPSGA